MKEKNWSFKTSPPISVKQLQALKLGQFINNSVSYMAQCIMKSKRAGDRHQAALSRSVHKLHFTSVERAGTTPKLLLELENLKNPFRIQSQHRVDL